MPIGLVTTRGRRTAAALLFFGLVTGLAPLARAQQPPAKAGAGEGLASPRVQKSLAVLERLRLITEQELRQPGACPWDVPAKASELNYDVDRTFAFVRDEVRYEPYAGVLRGARGALLCRGANAADKALLLRALLEAGGHRCRVVTGTLPDDKAKALVGQFLASDPSKSPLAAFAGDAPPDEQALQKYAQRAGLDPALVKESERRDHDEAMELRRAVSQSAAREAEWLLSRLAQANTPLGKPLEQWTAELAARAKEHAWVQVERDGKLVDLDPSFAGAKPGDVNAPSAAPAAAAKPGEEVAGDGAGALQRHRTRLKLMYATDDAGKTTEQALLDVTLYADRSFFDPASFSIVPVEPQLPGYAQAAAMKPEQLQAALAGLKKFQASVRNGGESYSSRPFDLDGHVYDVAADGRIAGSQAVGAATGGLFGGLGGGLGGGAGAKEKEGPKFVQLSVEIGVESPGQPPRVQRRVLLTAEGRAKSGPLCVIREWDLLVQGFPITGDAAQYAGASNILATYGPLIELFRKPDVSLDDAERFVGSLPPAYPAALVEFAMLRQTGMAELTAGAGKAALLWDRPQVYVADRHGCACHGGEYNQCLKLDIVDNGLSLVPREAGGDAAAGAARLAVALGAYDTCAEAALVRAVAPAGAVSSAVGILASARIQGSAMAVFAADGKGAQPAQAPALSAADMDWIRRYEAPGRVILAAASRPAGADAAADTGAWWSVDPATGATLGRVSGGAGQAQTEYKTITIRIAEHMICNLGWMAELIRGARDFEKGKLTALGGAKRGAMIAYNMASCIMKFPKADFKSPVGLKEAWAAAKGLKGGFAGIADALAG
jgi:hypothetical protein